MKSVEVATILNIETSTRICSVALAVDGKIIMLKESGEKNAHASNITLFSESVVHEAQLSFDQLDAVAVSMGPGSYTGLRIGVSTAKGYCYALDIPLLAIGTLKALAYGMIQDISTPDDHLFIPLLDARRMEVYMAVYDSRLNPVQPVRAEVVDENSFSELLKKNKVVFAGDGAAKCKDLFQDHPNARFLEDLHPSSSFIAPLANSKFLQKQFEDVAYFEPFYLKDFVAGIPKVKGLK